MEDSLMSGVGQERRRKEDAAYSARADSYFQASCEEFPNRAAVEKQAHATESGERERHPRSSEKTLPTGAFSREFSRRRTAVGGWCLDRGLCRELKSLIAGRKAFDFGAGAGHY